jgi:hypothetical protein
LQLPAQHHFKKIKFMSGTGLLGRLRGGAERPDRQGFIIVGVEKRQEPGGGAALLRTRRFYSDFEPVLKQVMDSVKLS